MKRIIFYNIIFALILVTAGCKKNMTELNTNPELVTQASPAAVFTSATNNWNNNSRSHLMGKYSGVMRLMQYIVGSGGGTEGIYVNPAMPTNPEPYLPYYRDFYVNHGNRLDYLYNVVIPSRLDKDLYQNIGAIARILHTYEAWLVFDTHGAAPYSDAFRGLQGTTTPKYDMFEDLYKRFDSIVKAQVELLVSKPANQVALGNNDFFYRGDVNKWIKFGNTLRIKMAQRFEKVDPAHYNAVLNDALANAGGIISNNDESCIYFHNIEYNNDTWDTAVLTYQYSASNAFVSFLTDNNDPRTPILLRRNGFGAGNNNPTNDGLADSLRKYFPDYATNPAYQRYVARYVGMPASPDMSDDSASREFISFNTTAPQGPLSFTIRALSQVQSRFYVKNGGNAETAGGTRNIDFPRNEQNDDMKLFSPQITYAETCFMMAEISEKAGSAKGGKDARTWYEDGIHAAMLQYQQWGVRMKVLSAANTAAADYAPITEDKISAYLAQPQIMYGGSQQHKLELIVSQAWVNFFMRPEEAWATWKRTGLPKFKEYSAPNPKDGTAFLDKITSGGEERLIPRRSILPTPNTANAANFEEALRKLTAKPEYLQPAQTHGRIFWDKQ